MRLEEQITFYNQRNFQKIYSESLKYLLPQKNYFEAHKNKLL